MTSAAAVLPPAESILELLPSEVSLDSLRDMGVLPLRNTGKVLVVGGNSPDAYPQAQLLGVTLGLPVELELCSPEALAERLRQLYDIKSGLREDSVNDIEGVEDLSLLAREDVLSDSVDAPVIKLMNSLLLEAVKEEATDIHMEPYEDEVVVRFRIDGVLHERLRLPKSHQAPIISRIKVMARMDIAHRFAPQDGRIGITLGGRAVDIRVGAVPTRHGERLALRLLDKARGVLTLEDLGMEKREEAIMKEIIRHPHGMILLTGPTGSGKTTTLYALLQQVAKPEVNVITVEDPVEYDLPGVAQIQVNEKAGVTFASALRAILRQDPDVVMVGEMRDFETAHIGVQASLTGHLVLSTLHTNDSVGVIPRLIDMGVESYLVAGSLLGTVAQRLVRRICPHCAQEEAAPAYLRPHGIDTVWRGTGCEACRSTGYRGRRGLYEQFILTENVREAIGRNASVGELRNIAKSEGMIPLWEQGLECLRRGITTPEEVSRVAGDARGA